ncbi:hypothetical protein HDC92_001378 [Pedobacter sp. AK017]|nr:hypothetical protein [Pedobacter sp. AK017]
MVSIWISKCDLLPPLFLQLFSKFLGYTNKVSENGHKYIYPDCSKAKIMKRAFNEIAHDNYNVSQIYFLAKRKGLLLFKE